MDAYRTDRRSRQSNYMRRRRLTAEEYDLRKFCPKENENCEREAIPADAKNLPAISTAVHNDNANSGKVKEVDSPLKKSKGKGRRTSNQVDSDAKSSNSNAESKTGAGLIFPTTMSGETAEQVDKFRQLKLKEFNAICSLCQSNNIVLDQALLERVLLHPRDNPNIPCMRRSIRQPGCTEDLLPRLKVESKHQQRAEALLPASKNKDVRMKVTSSGRIMTERVFPAKRDVEPKLHKMRLSTGKILYKYDIYKVYSISIS